MMLTVSEEILKTAPWGLWWRVLSGSLMYVRASLQLNPTTPLLRFARSVAASLR
jgi:hypothetical protein